VFPREIIEDERDTSALDEKSRLGRELSRRSGTTSSSWRGNR